MTVFDAVAALHKAALAGDPRSMARFVQGEPFTVAITMSHAPSPSAGGSAYAWITDPAFDAWRRDAARIRDAGLARADIPMLIALAQGPAAGFGGVIPLDPVQRAAATRALAGILGDDTPPSTRTLGLMPGTAEDADRMADAWIRTHREQHAGPSDEQRREARLREIRQGPSTCD